MTVIVNPDELEAMIESGGVASSMSANSLILKSGRSGPFSWSNSACARRETDIRQSGPRFLNILAQVCFGIRSGVCCDHIEPARQILRRPARTDYSSADDRDTLHWLIERP